MERREKSEAKGGDGEQITLHAILFFWAWVFREKKGTERTGMLGKYYPIKKGRAGTPHG
jgi:hypothetical protein